MGEGGPKPEREHISDDELVRKLRQLHESGDPAWVDRAKELIKPWIMQTRPKEQTPENLVEYDRRYAHICLKAGMYPNARSVLLESAHRASSVGRKDLLEKLQKDLDEVRDQSTIDEIKKIRRGGAAGWEDRVRAVLKSWSREAMPPPEASDAERVQYYRRYSQILYRGRFVAEARRMLENARERLETLGTSKFSHLLTSDLKDMEGMDEIMDDIEGLETETYEPHIIVDDPDWFLKPDRME